MAGCIEAALGLLTTLGDMFIPAHPFFRSLPRPIRWILQVALGVLVVVAVVAFVIVVGAFSIQFLLYLVDQTMRYFASLTWGAVTDVFSFTGTLLWDAGSILATCGSSIAVFAGFGAGSLVAATEATHEGVQDLLRRCAMSQTPDLMLDASTSISCEALNRQLDSPPSMTKLRRQSMKLYKTISHELAREFKDLVRFLHLLRDSPASAALDPRIPRSGFASRWQSIQHRLGVVYRTVWCRWLHQQPASTLKHRKSQLLELLKAGPKRREEWKNMFSDLEETIHDKFSQSCSKGGCKEIEKAARNLGPASLSPASLFGVLSPPPKSNEKALIEQRERSFELQKLAAKCVAKCTLLEEHEVALRGVVTWLEAEFSWWTKFEEDHRNSTDLMVERFDMSLLADLVRFEGLLDDMARTAMGRKGPH
ncbi:hypothetical protein F5144DRAFT_598915 [Chaetomium tenue]|uniref:Uncharacterized protein n=1 Tax=Chaetomium tenue TaxID=1854479 RepID=A0ACB7PII6_9PEZI|nr:hypothetical protein F5144DRAFT_598915 [Chaetomium globosum]